MSSVPRNEYPRPQFQREDWLCLNGTWDFELDPSDTGMERGLLNKSLTSEILVPFCPESELSGVNTLDHINAVWYRRVVDLPASWAQKRALLHFQAVDHDATVWVDGVEVARHRGGWSGFSVDLGIVPKDGKQIAITVRARDDHRQPAAKGKQSSRYENYECFYHRTTGIWQTVWLEPVSVQYLKRPRITPVLDEHQFLIEMPVFVDQSFDWSENVLQVQARLQTHDECIAMATSYVGQQMIQNMVLQIPKEHIRKWSMIDPYLYDLEFRLYLNGEEIDQVDSYAGLRSISIQGKAILLNGEAVFQRLVLDQGYYPDGLMTAPSDDAMLHDILISLDAGFNGARLHQKVFEERFLYHADRLGYLCWGEYGDWGIDRENPPATYMTQWLEILERDYSHPSLIGWCPLNETWNVPLTDGIDGLDDLTRGMYLAAKMYDPTRPVVDASGGAHRVPWSDVYDVHDYEQDPEKFAENHRLLSVGKPLDRTPEDQPLRSTPYIGGPYFVSEFGGTWWSEKVDPNDKSWGYGQKPTDIQEVYRRIEGLCSVLLNHSGMFGYCYTQLTDVFQEKNGLYTFDRRPKFDMKRIAATQKQVAAIEKMSPDNCLTNGGSDEPIINQQEYRTSPAI